MGQCDGGYLLSRVHVGQYIKDRISVREGVYEAVKQRFIKGNSIIHIGEHTKRIFGGDGWI